jgi:hypothetical protein
MPPKKRRNRTHGGGRAAANEVAIAAVDPHWETLAQRRDLGIMILANTLACGIGTTDAVEMVADHPWLRDPKTNRGPVRSTVWQWLKEASFEDIEIKLDPMSGKPVRASVTMDIDERRRQYLGRVDASVVRWTAQGRALAQRLKVKDQPLEEVEQVHKAMIRCDKMALEFQELGIRLLHIDKIPPLERLDDPEVRQVLRSHIERSLAYFTTEEREAWRELFTDSTVAAHSEVSELRSRLVQ